MKRRVRIGPKVSRRRLRVAVGSVTEIRRALTVAGDIRSDVEFQNDVNALLATVGKLTALGPQPDDIDIDIDMTQTPVPIATTPEPVVRGRRPAGLTTRSRNQP